MSKTWEELHCAKNLKNFSLNEYEGIAYVSFPSFQEIEHFNDNGSKYGEGNIQTDNNVFSTSLEGNDDQPALAHLSLLLSPCLLFYLIGMRPFESIAKPLLFGSNKPDSFIPDACKTLYGLVLQKELDTVAKKCPYKPFGTHMFCSLIQTFWHLHVLF